MINHHHLRSLQEQIQSVNLSTLNETNMGTIDNTNHINHINSNNSNNTLASITPIFDESFIKIEFFYLLLPCYYFSIIGLQRYLFITREIRSDYIPYMSIHTSFYIKKWLSRFMCWLYIASFIIAKMEPVQELKYVSFLYFSGTLAWYLSEYVLEAESKKGLPQTFYAHRLFWIASLVCTWFRLAEYTEHKLACNIINLSKLSITFILTIYAIYKPDDTEEDNEDDHMPTIIRAFLACIERNEIVKEYLNNNNNDNLNIKTEPLFSTKHHHHQQQQQRQQQYDPAPRKKSSMSSRKRSSIRLSTNGPEFGEEYKTERRVTFSETLEYEKSIIAPDNTNTNTNATNANNTKMASINKGNYPKAAPSNTIGIDQDHNISPNRPRLSAKRAAEEKFLLQKLPKVNIILSKGIFGREIEQEIIFYYKILTKINNSDTFIVEHRYFDFLELERYIKTKFSRRSYPSYHDKIPILKKINTDDYPTDDRAFLKARRDSLENFLNEFIAKPVYIDRVFLDFLGIKETHAEDFLNYHEFISSLQHNRESKLINSLEYQNKLKEIENSRLSYESDISIQESDIADPEFVAEFEDYEKSEYGDRYEYIFIVYDKIDNKITWRLHKSYADFKTLADSLSTKLGLDLHKYFKSVPCPIKQTDTNDPKFLNQRKEGLQKFMNIILEIPDIYIDTLYEFLDYDIIRRLPNSNVYERKLTEDLIRRSIIEKRSFEIKKINGILCVQDFNDTESHTSNEEYIPMRELKPIFPYKIDYDNVNTNNTSNISSINQEKGDSLKGITSINLKNCNVRLTIPEDHMNSTNNIEYAIDIRLIDPIERRSIKAILTNYKTYDDFEELHRELYKIYQSKGIILPQLPIKGKFDHEEMRDKLHNYCINLFKIDHIGDLNAIREFFKLDDIFTLIHNE